MAVDTPDFQKSVTQVISTNAPWQAPSNFASTARTTGNVTVAIVSPVGGKTFYVFGWSIFADGTAGTVGGVLARIVRHSDGALIGGLSIESAPSPTAAGIVPAWASGYHGGAMLGPGDGVDLIIDSQPTGAGVRAAISYSQT